MSTSNITSKKRFSFLYWIKWTYAYIYIRIYNALHRWRFDLYDVNAVGDPVKLGFIVPQLEKDLESPFPESHLEEASDEVMFYGVNSKSECVLVRVARASNQVADAWIHVKLSNGKTYQLAESVGHQQPFEGGNCTNFSCGRLQVHYLSPMRRWRIFYCGMLKETTESGAEETVFVKFVFLWIASSDVYDLTTHAHPERYAHSLAKIQWEFTFVPPINKFVEATNFYAQSGVMTGTISANDSPDYEMYLFGEKMRDLSTTENIVGYNFMNILGNVPGNGFTFHLGKSSAPPTYKDLEYGFTVTSDATLNAIKKLDVKILHVNASVKTLSAVFTAVKEYEVCGTVIGPPILLHNAHGRRMEAIFIEFTLGDKKGSGLLLEGEIYKEQIKPEKSINEPLLPKNIPLTVSLSDEVSHFREISGGKGSSLARLMKMSNGNKLFTVPRGIIVTTSAYLEFITPEILNSVKNLENILYGNMEGDIKLTCKLVQDIIERTLLPEKLSHSIIKDLKLIFGDEINQYKFAVRSSATDEDSAVMSAAGQMNTFLGIPGVKKITLAVKKCWASQFTHTAIEYRKRYGQILNSPMAVVVQEMVACQVSGVLFTCDPVTNNPSCITITANYGLGESVVSGSVEPDTIILKRGDDERIEFDSVLVGTKHQRLVMRELGGTITEDVPERERGRSCLSKELAMRLGKVATKIENYFRSSRDIEWGILNEDLYILQSRPVTNAAAETEFEMKHGLDSPLRTENELLSVANVGEILPGAMSPLGIDLFLTYYTNIGKREVIKKFGSYHTLQRKYFSSGLLIFYNHVMMNVLEVVMRFGVDNPVSKGIMMSLFGRILDDPVLVEEARERAQTENDQKLPILRSIRNFKDIFFSDTENARKRVWEYHLNFLKEETASNTFTSLLNSCSDFEEAGTQHLQATGNSSIWNMFIFMILIKTNKGVFDTDVYSDFSRLLVNSTCVESVNIPEALQDVALEIANDMGSEKFKSMSVEGALEWLNKSTTRSGYKFRQFVERHGHRGYQELDVRSVSWGMDLKILVQYLKNIIGQVKESEKKEKDEVENTIMELNVPLGFISRILLKFVLSKCHKAVKAREATKNILVKSYDHWRMGFRHFAQQMVSEGRIPDTDLIFFFTLNEIKELLETRSPCIISRAICRRKIFSTLEDYKFPEMMRGQPKPDNDSETFKFVADLTMKGIPVSQGMAKGYARVVKTLQEASELKHGEILITYSTDIGWCPYFPIISGVVTELGGLISHGAVVSREYGLPCIVGLQGATKQFHTGDYVLLDGKKGILQKLPLPKQY